MICDLATFQIRLQFLRATVYREITIALLKSLLLFSHGKGRSENREAKMPKYGRSAAKTVESAMRRRKRGTLRSGKGGKGGVVKSRKQAIAIGLSEARKKGAKVPRKRSS